MTNAEIFRKAADYIREHGWVQGDYSRDEEGVCAWGALNTVQGEPTRSPKMTELDRLVDARFSHGRYGLADWNDAPERTAAEVIELFESMAFDEDLKAAAQSPLPAETGKTLATNRQLVEAVA